MLLLEKLFLIKSRIGTEKVKSRVITDKRATEAVFAGVLVKDLL